MKYLKLKNYLVCLVAFILLFGSCKEKKKTIDDISFITKGCYTENVNFFQFIIFKKISEDVLYFTYKNAGRKSSWNLKIDESGKNLVGIEDGGGQILIPIPKNENDQLFYKGGYYQKTTNCDYKTKNELLLGF